MSNTKRELLQVILQTFPKSPLPSRVVNEEDSTLEARIVENFFKGRQWVHISLRQLQDEYEGDGSACLWFMTAESVAYYLPTYLSLCVLDFKAADMIAVSTVVRLREVAEGGGSNISTGLGLLDVAQNAAIAQVLTHVATDADSSGGKDDAARALNLRWQRFL